MDKIYDEYYYKIYNWAIKKTNHKEDAEDLTNSVFLAIFEYFNKNIKQKIKSFIVIDRTSLFFRVIIFLFCLENGLYV